MKRQSAFTLIEVMVVVAIMVAVISLAAPAMRGVMQGSQLTQAGQMVVAQVSLARQTAITQNHDVEVRFYKCGDPASSRENTADARAWRIRALQSFIIVETGNVSPLGKVNYLPQGTIIDSGATLSSLFDSGKRGCNVAPTVSLPGIKKSYSYFVLRFRPDGTTDLALTNNGAGQLWFLSLHYASDGDGLAYPPANFWTIQVDPVNGTLNSFRP